MKLGDHHKVDCLMVYIEVAVSNMMLDDSAIGKMINHFWEISPDQIQEFVRNNSLGIADVKKLKDMEEAISALLTGCAVFFMDGYDKAMKISSKGYPGLGVKKVRVVANKVRNEDDEAFIKERIPEEDLLGFIHYNPEVIDADRQGKSPYDCSETAVEEIKKIKEKLEA